MAGCIEGGGTVRPGRARPTARAAARRTGERRSGSPSSRSATCARIVSSVAKLVISATGTVAPTERSSEEVCESFASRKLIPSTASSTALTTPPKRVAIPPASTTCATSPLRERLETRGSCALVARLARGRERRQVVRGGRLDELPGRGSTPPRARPMRPSRGVARIAARRSRTRRGRPRRSCPGRRSRRCRDLRRERGGIRRAVDAGLGDDRGDEVGRSHVEGRVVGGKRDEISVRSRSSMGMAAPLAVAGSTVEVGATT